MSFSHLKTAIASAVFLLMANFCIAQIDTSLVFAHIPKDHQARIIVDPKTHVRYILDTAHIYIEAIDEDGKQIWKTDPWKAPSLNIRWMGGPSLIFFVLGMIIQHNLLM